MSGEYVQGVKETIKTLNSIEPGLQKKFKAEATQIAAPIVDAAKASYPSTLLSGMTRKWSSKSKTQIFPWAQGKAVRGVKVAFTASKRSESVIKVIQKDAAASVVEFAGKKNATEQGARFAAALSSASRTPARFMWPAALMHRAQVEEQMKGFVQDVMKDAQGELN